MSGFNRDTVKQLRDPALAGRWMAMVDNQSAPKLAVESINPGILQGSSNQRFYGGKYLQFPGFAQAVSFSMVVYETHDYQTLAWFNDWRKEVFDPETSIYGLPVDYKREVRILMYSLASSGVPAATFVISGAWPISVAGLDLSYANQEGRLVHNVEMAADSVEFQLR